MSGQTDLVFKAIADPTRRAIFHMLAMSEQPLTITDIATHFPASRQAIRKHIGILESANLAQITGQGRTKQCTANAVTLQVVQQWISYYERFWEQKLTALGDYLNEESEQNEPKE